ncbi:hypothetical protein M3J09_012122 [Ascochyta lentis]
MLILISNWTQGLFRSTHHTTTPALIPATFHASYPTSQDAFPRVHKRVTCNENQESQLNTSSQNSRD